MLSPTHIHGFAKSTDINNFERSNNFNYTVKVPGSSQGNRGSSVKGNSTMVINPQNIEFARAQTNSQKDKRLTMFPEDIKKFIIENNKEKCIKKEFETMKNQDMVPGGSVNGS